MPSSLIEWLRRIHAPSNAQHGTETATRSSDRRKTLKLLAGLPGMLFGSSALASPLHDSKVKPRGRAPNFIVFITDDQNHLSLGAAGNPAIRTPHMDRLASAGAYFRNSFVTTSICPVNRACLMTGQTVRRHGIDDFEKPLSKEAFAESFPGRLRAAGYRTGYVGKYGIGAPREDVLTLSLPEDEFDLWYGFPQSFSYRQSEGARDRYVTDIMTERARRFLLEKQDERPFLLIVGFKEPHGAYDFFDPAVADPYVAAEVPTPSTLTGTAFERLPPFIRSSLSANKARQWLSDREAFKAWLRRRYRLITRADQAIGELMEAVREAGGEDDTVVIFTADNGFMTGQHGLSGKWLMYEDSIRVPLIIHDPRIAAARRRRIVTEMVLSIDIAPTILETAGLRPSSSMQGRSLRPLLDGARTSWRKDWYYEHDFRPRPSVGTIPRSEGVRTGRWKYIRYPEQDPVYEQLFDLESDPQELVNLALERRYGNLLARLRSRCDALRREMS